MAIGFFHKLIDFAKKAVKAVGNVISKAKNVMSNAVSAVSKVIPEPLKYVANSAWGLVSDKINDAALTNILMASPSTVPIGTALAGLSHGITKLLE